MIERPSGSFSGNFLVACVQRPSGVLRPGEGEKPMLFVWLGFLKEGAEPDQQVQQETNQFLVQPYMPIRAAGALRDPQGRRAAMMMMFEAESRAAAEALVASSPYKRAGLYDRYDLFEYQDEVG
jgi:uncharacterized protein YciI